MKPNSMIPIIEAHYDSFTNIEKYIGDFFLANETILDFSSNKIAGQLHVSPASLSRFAQKMGYRGFQEFIYHYSESFQNSNQQLQAEAVNVMNAYEELIHRTQSLMNDHQLEQIATHISHAKRIFLYGFGSSGLAAEEFRLRLIRLGLDVEAITEFHQLVMNRARIHKECLVIGLSLSGESAEIIDAMKEAGEKGATTIFITSNQHTQLQSFIDEVVFVAVKKNLEYGNVISLQIPILLVLDVIYSKCLKYISRNTAASYDKLLYNKIKKYHASSPSIPHQ